MSDMLELMSVYKHTDAFPTWQTNNRNGFLFLEHCNTFLQFGGPCKTIRLQNNLKKLCLHHVPLSIPMFDKLISLCADIQHIELVHSLPSEYAYSAELSHPYRNFISAIRHDVYIQDKIAFDIFDGQVEETLAVRCNKLWLSSTQSYNIVQCLMLIDHPESKVKYLTLCVLPSHHAKAQKKMDAARRYASFAHIFELGVACDTHL